MKHCAPQSHFDAIKHVDESGEYWSARELATLLDYTEWRNFEKVIKKAIKACQSSNRQVSDHFVDINKMIATAKGAQNGWAKRLIHLCYIRTIWYTL